MKRPWPTTDSVGLTIVLVLIAMLAMSGVAAAAASGTFSSTFDGYDDGQSSDVAGHEIQVEGELEVSGSTAVDPTIRISSTENTVLKSDSVRVFVEGDTSISFDQRYGPSGVTLSAEEIPSGTTIRVQYVVYPVGGMTGEIQSSTVSFDYETPSGEDTGNEFDVTTDMSGSAQSVIDQLQQGEQLSQLQEILSWIGVLAAVVFVLWLGMKLVGGFGGGSGPGDTGGGGMP